MNTITSELVGFNPSPPEIMFIDLNSCFASIEQQADYLLRGKPVAVGAYTTPSGCILAASYEAKRCGVKTGMRVWEGRKLCPDLIVVPSDPPKYRYINKQLFKLFSEYSPDVFVKSIDEMVLVMSETPALRKYLNQTGSVREAMHSLGLEIKKRIVDEVGDSLRVSIGIAPNRYLAKIASGLEKPDGMSVIDIGNYLDQLSRFKTVEELNGIKKGYGNRLRLHGITSALEFYHASIETLKMAFHSVVGYHWWLRLHGWEADDRDVVTRSIGHSYALPRHYSTTDVRLQQILNQLTARMARRMRQSGFQAKGIHLGLVIAGDSEVGPSPRHSSGKTFQKSYWHKSLYFSQPLFTSSDLHRQAQSLLRQAPTNARVRLIDIASRHLVPLRLGQQSLFDDDTQKWALTKAIDEIQSRWGELAIMPGKMLNISDEIVDRIAFGTAGVGSG